MIAGKLSFGCTYCSFVHHVIVFAVLGLDLSIYTCLQITDILENHVRKTAVLVCALLVFLR